jgi:hypothetical protein
MSELNDLAELVEAGRRILHDCSKIQDLLGLADDFPVEERRVLANQLAHEYHSWYAKAQALLPDFDRREIEKLYLGHFLSHRVKAFFEGPLAVNPMHNEQTAALISRWLYPYETTLKSNMMQQITVLERRLQQRPAVIMVAGGEIRLPRNLKGHQRELESFLSKHPFERNVFLMMKYRDHNRHVGDIIRAAVERAGLKLWLANEVRITDELASNMISCLLCCKYGIALFDEPEDQQHINPNVAYELGMMHLLDRECLILKSKNVSIQSDILAKLYVSYDPATPGDIIRLTQKWLIEVGATSS